MEGGDGEEVAAGGIGITIGEDDDTVELQSHSERMGEYYRRDLRCVDLFEVLEILLRVFRREQAARDAEVVAAMQAASKSDACRESTLPPAHGATATGTGISVDLDSDDEDQNTAMVPQPAAPRDGWRASRAARPCAPLLSHCREDEVLEAVKTASSLPSLDAIVQANDEKAATAAEVALGSKGHTGGSLEANEAASDSRPKQDQEQEKGQSRGKRRRRDAQMHHELLMAPETLSEARRETFLMGQADTTLSLRQTLQVLSQLCPQTTLLEACGVFADAYFVYSGLMAKTAVRLGGPGRVNVASLWRSVEARGLLGRSMSLPSLSPDGWAPAIGRGQFAVALSSFSLREQGIQDRIAEVDVVPASSARSGSSQAVASQAARLSGLGHEGASRRLLLEWSP